MTTVVNNPPATNTGGDNGSGGMGMVLGVLLAIIIVFLFVVFAWPALQGKGGGTPSNGGNTDGTGGTTLNIPDKIDVNIEKK